MTGNKEIDAILAEMRRDADAGGVTILTPLGLRTYADRMEAAAQKERAILDANIARVRKLEGILGDAADAMLGCAIKQKQAASGNVGLLRAALLKVLDSYKSGAIRTEYNDPDSWKHDDELCYLKDDVESALKAPPRNCDVPGRTLKELARAFRDANCDQYENSSEDPRTCCEGRCVECVCKWMLSPAEGSAE